MVQHYERFQLVPETVGQRLLLNELEANLKMYFDWALLLLGNWTNIDYSLAGPNTTLPGNSDPAKLRLVDDPAYTSGQVWEGYRKDWVWEQGVNYVSPIDGDTYNPNTVSVYVNGVLQNASTYSVNYPLGRIIFNTAKASTATVRAQHAFRWVQVQTLDEAQWFRTLQFGSLNGNNTDFLQEDADGGGWSIGSQHRIQMPSIVMEFVPSRYPQEGYELGNVSQWTHQDVLIHVVAEDSYMRNNIVDIFRLQQEKTIWLFNSKDVIDDDAWPLDANGEIATANVYPDLVDEDGYRWKKCYFVKAVWSDTQAIHPNLFEGKVRLTAAVVMGQI